MKTITLSLETLKKHADLLAKAVGGLNHSEALETVAKVFYGYKDYHQAQKELKNEPTDEIQYRSKSQQHIGFKEHPNYQDGIILYRTLKFKNGEEVQFRMIPMCWVDGSFASLDAFWASKPDLDNLPQVIEEKSMGSWDECIFGDIFMEEGMVGKRKDQIAFFENIEVSENGKTYSWPDPEEFDIISIAAVKK